MRGSSRARPGRLRGSALVPATLVSAAGVTPVTAIPVLYPRIAADIPGFTVHGLGLSTTLCFAVTSLASPLMGRIADRVGPRRGVVSVAIGAIAVLNVIAAAQSATVLIAAIAFSGLLHATASASSNLVMGRVLDGRRPATMFGLRQAAVPMVAIAAGAAAATVGTHLDWRAIVLLFCVVPVAVVAVRPREGPIERRPGTGGPLPAMPRAELLLLCGVGLFSGAGVSSLNTYGVATLTDAGLDAGPAGAVFSIASAAGLAVRLAAGVVVDRYAWPAPGAVSGLLATGCVGAVAIAYGSIGAHSADEAENTWVVSGVIIAYAFGWGFPGLLQYVVASTFRGRIGSATGVVQFGSAIGVSGGPMAFAGIEIVGGLEAAWVMVAASWVVAAVIAASFGMRFRYAVQTLDDRSKSV